MSDPWFALIKDAEAVAKLRELEAKILLEWDWALNPPRPPGHPGGGRAKRRKHRDRKRKR